MAEKIVISKSLKEIPDAALAELMTIEIADKAAVTDIVIPEEPRYPLSHHSRETTWKKI